MLTRSFFLLVLSPIGLARQLRPLQVRLNQVLPNERGLLRPPGPFHLHRPHRAGLAGQPGRLFWWPPGGGLCDLPAEVRRGTEHVQAALLPQEHDERVYGPDPGRYEFFFLSFFFRTRKEKLKKQTSKTSKTKQAMTAKRAAVSCPEGLPYTWRGPLTARTRPPLTLRRRGRSTETPLTKTKKRTRSRRRQPTARSPSCSRCTRRLAFRQPRRAAHTWTGSITGAGRAWRATLIGRGQRRPSRQPGRRRRRRRSKREKK